MTDRFTFTLDSVEAVMVGRVVNADVRRFPLRIRDTPVDPVRYTKLAVLVREELERRGLCSADTLHSSVRTALELFAGYQAPGSGTLRFSLFSDEELVSTVAGFLPKMPAAPRGTLTVEHRPAPSVSAMTARRRAAAEADAEETDAFGNIDVVGGFESEPDRPRAPRSDAERLSEIMSGARLGSGFLAVSGQRRSGERRSVPPVGWVDIGVGRYLVRTATEANGTTVVTYRPAGASELQAAVRQIISSVY